jgi:hypothetical protein
MQPFDYRINAGQPFGAVMQGVQQGLALDNALTQRDTLQLQRADVQSQIEARQAAQVQAQQRQQRFREQLAPMLTKPTAAGLRTIVTEFPEMAAPYKELIAGMAEEEKRAAKLIAQPLFAAVTNGQIDVAKRLAEEAQAAYEAQGMAPEAAGMKAMRMQLDSAQPGQVAVAMGSFLSALDGPGFAETLGKLGVERRAEAEAPAKLTEAQAKAQIAAVAAKFAESNAALDLQKKGWDITKIQEDIKINKLNAQIAAASVAASREGNALKRDELALKVEEMKRARDAAVRERVAEVETGRAGIDNLLDTADQVLNTPSDVKRAAMGPVDSRLPTIQQDVADFEAKVETLGSQVFLAAIPQMKGLGALTEAEGKRLEFSLKSLSLKQSPEQFDKNMQEVQRLMLKARKNLAVKHGVPETVPDTPSAAGAPASDIEALVNKYAPR